MKSIIIFAVMVACVSAWEKDDLRSIQWEEMVQPGMDFRNASYNISEFMQGFAYGAFGEPIHDIAGCANDTVDIIKTLERDFKPIMNGTSIEKAAAVSDLIWHLVRDIPEILLECGHLKNKTMDIIEITEALFREMKDFHIIARALFSAFGPALKVVTAAAIAFEQGDWYKAGLNIGKVFRIIAEYVPKPDPEPVSF